MIRTNSSYINEFKVYDDVFDCINNIATETASLTYEYNKYKQNAVLRMMFEDENKEKSDNGENTFFGKIGKMVADFIRKIAEVITSIAESIHAVKKEDPNEKLTKMLKDHPELAPQIAHGLKQEWFTTRDVIGYEKDIIGLMNMLEQNKINHQQFKDKLKEAADKFEKSAKPLLTIGVTASTLITIIPKMIKDLGQGNDSLERLAERARDFERTYAENRNDHNAGVVSSAFNALAHAIGLTVRHCRDRQQALNNTTNSVDNATGNADNGTDNDGGNNS